MSDHTPSPSLIDYKKVIEPVEIGSVDWDSKSYDMENIDQARHTHELIKQDSLTLNLDYKQHGLGSASCGPDVLEKYELRAQDFAFAVRLVPFSSNEDPFHVAKTTLPKRL